MMNSINTFNDVQLSSVGRLVILLCLM